jgi:aminoglycoside 6'-N-acetyltransferase I
MAEAPAGIAIVPATVDDVPRWAAMRALLWPDSTSEQHAAELRTLAPFDRRYLNLLALAGDEAIGFAEISLRSDHVNGCDSSPVAFLEGIWVAPAQRRAGVGRHLVAAAAEWAFAAGCSEFGSDARLENTASHAFHRAIGFAETSRVVYFRKELK